MSGIAGDVPRPPMQTIVVAWGIEIACILIGFLVAYIAGIEHAKFGALVAFSAAAPFAAGAIVEIGRIPLVKAAFSARGWIWLCFALFMILISATLTFNNLMFGFERAFNLRVEAVRAQAQTADEKAAAAAALEQKQKALLAQQDELDRKLADLDKNRAALSGVVATASADTGPLNDLLHSREQERLAMVARQNDELREAKTACTKTPKHCIITYVTHRQAEERAAFDQQMNDLQAAIVKRAADAGAQSGIVGAQIDSLNAQLQQVGAQLSDAQSALKAANAARDDALTEADTARGQSQMHRLAKFMLGNDDDASAERVVSWLATVSALALAFAGTGLAAMYYRVKTQDPIYVRSAWAREQRLNRAFRKILGLGRRPAHAAPTGTAALGGLSAKLERITQAQASQERRSASAWGDADPTGKAEQA
jgi:hypothetical protein